MPFLLAWKWLLHGPDTNTFCNLSKHLLFCSYPSPMWMTVFTHWGVCRLLEWLNLSSKLWLMSERSLFSFTQRMPLRRKLSGILKWVPSRPILLGAACPQRWPAPYVRRSRSTPRERREGWEQELRVKTLEKSSDREVIWPPSALVSGL